MALPFFAVVGKEAGFEDQCVGTVNDLDRGEYSTAVGSVCGSNFDLFEEIFDREVWVPVVLHARVVLFEIGRINTRIGVI